MEGRDAFLILVALVAAAEAVALVSLFRLVGQLYVRVGPAAPPSMAAGPAIGETISSVAADGGQVVEIPDGDALLVFLRPGCRPCHDLIPSLRPFGSRYDVKVLAIVASDDNRQLPGLDGVETIRVRDAVERYGIDSTPFVIWVRDREVRAKSVANHMEHLESLHGSIASTESHSHAATVPIQ